MSPGGISDLQRFFERAIRATFRDLVLADDPAVSYLADLLTRFARTENLHPRGTRLPRLETVVDLLIEASQAWSLDSPSFRPEHEVTVKRHLGDYTLFMTGVFPERVDRVASTGLYVTEGRRAYRFVAEYARASAGTPASIFRRLADRFEAYVGALDYARRVHFRDHPDHPFFRVA